MTAPQHKQKTVLVTGASAGIGQAISHTLLNQGHRVIGMARDFSRSTLNHAQFTPVPIDLMDTAKLSNVIKELLKQWPHINALVSNAGSGKFGNLEEFSFAHIHDAVQLNLTSHICLVRALLPHFKRQQCAHIILMGSETALDGGIKGAVYSACKAGLRGLAQSLRKECARSGLHISIINPGMVKTEFHNHASFQPGERPNEHLLADDIAHATAMVLNAREGCVFDEINLSPLKKVVTFTR